MAAARFPIVLVRGIQVSVALLLAKAAVDLAERGNWEGLPAIDPTLSLAIATAICAASCCCGTRRIPGALMALAAGVVVGIVAGGIPGPVTRRPRPGFGRPARCRRASAPP